MVPTKALAVPVFFYKQPSPVVYVAPNLEYDLYILGLHLSACRVQWRIFLWQWKRGANPNASGFLHHVSVWIVWRTRLLHSRHHPTLGEPDESFQAGWNCIDTDRVPNSSDSDRRPPNKLQILQRAWRRHLEDSCAEPVCRKSSSLPNLWFSSLDEKLLQQLWEKKVRSIWSVVTSDQ